MPGPELQEPQYRGIRNVLYGFRIAMVNVRHSGIPWWRLPAEVASNLRLRARNGWVCCGNHAHPGC